MDQTSVVCKNEKYRDVGKQRWLQNPFTTFSVTSMMLKNTCKLAQNTEVSTITSPTVKNTFSTNMYRHYVTSGYSMA